MPDEKILEDIILKNSENEQFNSDVREFFSAAKEQAPVAFEKLKAKLLPVINKTYDKASEEKMPVSLVSRDAVDLTLSRLGAVAERPASETLSRIVDAYKNVIQETPKRFEPAKDLIKNIMGIKE